jgi:hypothetical protein
MFTCLFHCIVLLFLLSLFTISWPICWYMSMHSGEITIYFTNFQNVKVCYGLFIYVLPLEIQFFFQNTRLNSKVRVCNTSRVENLNPINRYNATIFCIQSQDFEFQLHMWWSLFEFSSLRWEVIVCFVDIDSIGDPFFS